MGILDWLHSSGREPANASGMSRRDFFARVAGQGPKPEEPAVEEPPNALYTFFVARFPYHDGPVLVPILKTGLDLKLVPDSGHPTDPDAVKIVWGRDHLGYVPAEHSADVRKRLAEGEALQCRSIMVDPGADLPRVLRVAIYPPEPPESDAAGEEEGESSAPSADSR